MRSDFYLKTKHKAHVQNEQMIRGVSSSLGDIQSYIPNSIAYIETSTRYTIIKPEKMRAPPKCVVVK